MKAKFLATFALLASASAALAGGAFNHYPIVGVPGNTACQSFGNNGVCNEFNPAGPTGLTGVEDLPADTGNLNGANPQTVTIPSALLLANSNVNRIIGGDFATNLWQRGTTFTALTPTTATMVADRWAAFSTGNTVTVTKQTGASDTIPTQGLYASMRVSRPSGTNTTQICVGQVFDKNWSAPLIGNNAIFSFWALASSSLATVASNQLQVNVAYYTAADSATPGTNTGTFMAGTTTGYTAAVAGPSNGTTATVSAGVATVPISTTWTRYSVYAPIPTTNTSGTAVTGVGVSICYTPTSGTGASTEWFEFEGAQLQAAPSTVTTQLPNGVTTPTAFIRRDAQLEADYQLWYSFVLTDAANTVRFGLCQATSATVGICPIQFPGPMRETPTTTVSTATSFGITVAAGTAGTCTTLAAVASSNTTSTGSLSCTTGSTLAAGNAAQFIGAATSGTVTFSGEP